MFLNIMLPHEMVEQESHFINLGNDIGYDRNYDIDVKLGKFQTNCGTINHTFRNKLHRDIKLKFYKLWQSLYCPMGANYGQ